MKSRVKPWREEDPTSPAPLNLTALLDVLSNLIFFLLVSYGAQSVLAGSAPRSNLPRSTSALALGRAITVSAGIDEIFVEDEPVVKLDTRRKADERGTIFARLEETLRRVRAERLAKNERRTEDEDLILFVGDKKLDFQTIDRVMKTCQRAGFTRFRFAVARGRTQ